MLADGGRVLACVVGVGDEVGCSWIGLVAGGLLGVAVLALGKNDGRCGVWLLVGGRVGEFVLETKDGCS
jgi:hypothetical protein